MNTIETCVLILSYNLSYLLVLIVTIINFCYYLYTGVLKFIWEKAKSLFWCEMFEIHAQVFQHMCFS